ncbi:MAG: YifB family Mg chelatase-like AAA ATPase [Myxococcota bacterium]|nr:YifB family Mg chelatase-like AAA ATPase [Myxococcota bacterium]
MVCTVLSGALCGIEGVAVGVEVDLLQRLPGVVIVGLAGSAIRESTERIRSAIQSAGLSFPRKRVVVNLAPADLKKTGSAFDLPIAVGILATAGLVDSARLEETCLVGELSLEGKLRPIRGALSLALMAAAHGAKRIILPADCAREAAVAPDIEILAAPDLQAVLRWLAGDGELPRAKVGAPAVLPAGPDLATVRGQHRAKRALEIAAAGGHNLLMIGPPGCGKSMLAARLPSILPALDAAEAIDITRIHSAAGLSDGGLVTQRPFRAPHHSISAAGMIGSASLQPGEVSLAHHGVLFLDEVPEFSRSVLELLRSPLEERRLTLCRAQGSVTLPASISLIAAANPCPCGYLGHPTRACICPPSALDRYRARLSGPLIDRIDLRIWVQPVAPEVLVRGPGGEPSSDVRARVVKARDRQRARLLGTGLTCNAELTGELLRQQTAPSAEAADLLETAIRAQGLSARGWSRILKVARTIADLDGVDQINTTHVLEASSYRLPDPT